MYYLCIVLEAVALEDNARAIAVAGELRGLKLAHRLDVGQRKLVHIINLIQTESVCWAFQGHQHYETTL